jgi:hypothetical protein
MEHTMMVILDKDLANVIQAERRQQAARERLQFESIRTASDPVPLLNVYRHVAIWLRAQAAKTRRPVPT